MKKGITRREFLNKTASLGGLAFLGAPLGFLRSLIQAGEARIFPLSIPEGLEVLSREEWTKIAYVVNVVFPKTENTPSGVEAGVLQYMNKSIQSPYARYKAKYKKLVTSLDFLSQKRHGGAFGDLNEVQRAQTVLEWIESKENRETFELLRRHSIEGYLSMPEHGGNIAGAGWKAVRYTCQPYYPEFDETCPATVHQHK